MRASRFTISVVAPLLGLLAGCGPKDGEEPPAPVDDCISGASLQATLDAAAPGDVIELCGGTQRGTWSVGADVEIVGSSGSTLDGDGVAPVLTVAAGVTLTLRSLTVQNGVDANAVAGGIDGGAAASLTLDDCVVRDNVGNIGGVLGPPAGPLVLTETTITGNEGETGGVSVFEGTLDGSGITGNTGSFYGGGVEVVSGGTVTAEGATIEGNLSTQYGGGVFLWDQTTWTGGTIRNNEATFAGGGVAIWAPRGVTIDGATIDTNTTPANGGGVAVVPQVGGLVSIVDSTIGGNTAHSGGGLHVLPGDHSVQLVGTAVDGNTASFGGGIYFGAVGVFGEPLLVGAGSSVSNNGANSGAGMLLTSPTRIDVVDAVIANNSASLEGGGAKVVEGILTSQSADWTANDPDDIWVNGVAASNLGTDATFQCDAALQDCW